ncbi:hypothetical protein HUJ04_003732 [Dendroctonus ponderosae]|nr:hypothetical protein HUJ04_003732 [Dendroctonus ponderosae]KAH1010461.1 hypothetical protein HUJ05_004752 [Dendroctonus ponderosae]
MALTMMMAIVRYGVNEISKGTLKSLPVEEQTVETRPDYTIVGNADCKSESKVDLHYIIEI